MSQAKTSILALPEIWDNVAQGYAQVTQPMFKAYSEQAIEALGFQGHEELLDVACGPGTSSLLMAPLCQQVQAVDFSEQMLQEFELNLQDSDIQNIEYQKANGQDLPFEEEEFDLAVSMFGWMFFPDRALGLSELHRVLKPQGKLALSAWQPRSQSPIFKLIMETMLHITPGMKEPPKIGNPLEEANVFEAEVQEAGFKNVRIIPMSTEVVIGPIEEFWENMVKGNAPIALQKKALPAREWKKRSKKAISYLKKNIQQESYEMNAYLCLAEK